MSYRTKKSLTDHEKSLVKNEGIIGIRKVISYKISRRVCSKEKTVYVPENEKLDIIELFDYVSNEFNIRIDSEVEAELLIKTLNEYYNGLELQTAQQQVLIKIDGDDLKRQELKERINDFIESKKPVEEIKIIGKDLKGLSLGSLRKLSLNIFEKYAVQNGNISFPSKSFVSNLFNMARAFGNITPGTEPSMLPTKEQALDMILSQILILTSDFYKFNSKYFENEGKSEDKEIIISRGRQGLKTLKSLL